MGGIREARTAGKTADPTVTAVPTTIAAITVRGSNTIPPAGRSMPRADIIALSIWATPMPRRKPAVDAVTPTTTASISWAEITCDRPVPMALRRAISRIRWVMTIWKVLKMVKLATTKPMIAKTSRRVSKKPKALAIMSCCSSMIADPVMAS